MDTHEQIKTYIDRLSEPKRSDMRQLHQFMLEIIPNGKLWFLDGKDEKGKVIANPSIGYGEFIINYKSGSSKAFYQIGISSNSTGISVYIMGLTDKKYLSQFFKETIGKATVTGYCIKFKTISDIHLNTLKEAVAYGLQQTTSHS